MHHSAVDENKDIIGTKYPVLDQGWVMLVDVMGNDADIIEAARVSYGKGTKPVSTNEDLLRYLMRHRHTTPFEMASLKFCVQVPMDCWRQWIRHRTASVNEYSTRYSEAIDETQATDYDKWRLQSDINKQGSSGCIPAHGSFEGKSVSGYLLTKEELGLQYRCKEVYRNRLKSGVAREQARKDLPLSTYTRAYWKIDLHNLFHFLGLRLDSHAQLEIRSYAQVIANITKEFFPLAYSAFEDYRLNAVSLSTLDIEAIKEINCIHEDYPKRISHVHRVIKEVFANQRERNEAFVKLVKLGIIPDDKTEA